MNSFYVVNMVFMRNDDLGKFFNESFDVLVSELSGDTSFLLKNREKLFDLSPSSREQEALVLDCFEAGSVTWWRYDDYLNDEKNEEDKRIEDRLDEINHLPLEDCLNYRRLDELRKLCRRMTGTAMSGKKKADVVSALAVYFRDNGIEKTILSTERRRIIAIERRKSEQRWVKDHNMKEMAFLFSHRLMMMAYSKMHMASSVRNKHHRPWLMLSTVCDSLTPQKCIDIDGTIKRIGDKFWEEHPVPCEKLFCRCTTISLSEEEAREFRN